MKKNRKIKKQKDINKYLSSVVGGIDINDTLSPPTLLRAADFAFVPMMSITDTNDKKWIPFSWKGNWVWQPKNVIKITNNSQNDEEELKEELLGWIDNCEIGDEPKE
ncbi:MAG: hypothetical protein LBT82_02815 [Oscillospiraceae bacterium]|jgi:hypothetical protein|nr:hypothetical protein [Oscillospiraceae bacterium]